MKRSLTSRSDVDEKIALGLLNRSRSPRNQTPSRSARMSARHASDGGSLGFSGDHNVLCVKPSGIGEAYPQSHSAELLRLNPDALLASNSPTLAFLGSATRTIPIVFANVSGVLARHSGNITGVLPVEPQITEKWVSVLRA